MGIGYGVTLVIAMAIAFAALIGAGMLARRQQRRMQGALGNPDLAKAIAALADELRRSNDLVAETLTRHDERLTRLERKAERGGGDDAAS